VCTPVAALHVRSRLEIYARIYWYALGGRALRDQGVCCSDMFAQSRDPFKWSMELSSTILQESVIQKAVQGSLVERAPRCAVFVVVVRPVAV
jgi:hypothetical protein